MFTTLHILADHHILVGRQLVLNHMQTPLTHYCSKPSQRATYTETHPNHSKPQIDTYYQLRMKAFLHGIYVQMVSNEHKYCQIPPLN
jgi:hypothetical protein